MHSQHPDLNQLLAALSTEDRLRMFPMLELVPMKLGDVLYESGTHLQHAYFPTDCIVSLRCLMVDQSSADIAIVGNEGLLGISLFMGGQTTTNRAVVQSGGFAYRLKGELLNSEFMRSASLSHLLLRYTQAMLTQISQTAACNRHHSLEQQLSRWLLSSFDCLLGNKLVMTHRLIANMLGMRREGVTEHAGKLKKAGVISYCRGTITLLDRKGLENTACECYAVVKNEFDRLLPRYPALE